MSPANNGHSPEAESFDLASFVAEVSARLVTVEMGEVTGPQLTSEQESAQIQVLIFALDEDLYALPVSCISEVLRKPAITYVPGLPDWISGVSNLHGNVISVVDLAAFLGIRQETPALNIVVVGSIGDQTIGLLVDRTELTYTFHEDLVESDRFRVGENLIPYLRGVFEWRTQMVQLLDGTQLLLGQRMQQFE